MPSDREHEFSQGSKSMCYEHVCLVTANSGQISPQSWMVSTSASVSSGAGPRCLTRPIDRSTPSMTPYSQTRHRSWSMDDPSRVAVPYGGSSMTLYAERKPSRHRPFAIIETRGSGRDILPPVAQAGDMDGYDVQAEIQVFPERLLLHLGREVLVG